MKHKVGDVVKVKSLEWYKKYKDEDGDVCFDIYGNICLDNKSEPINFFSESMKQYCGKEFTISEIGYDFDFYNYFYYMEGIFDQFIDEMLEVEDAVNITNV